VKQFHMPGNTGSHPGYDPIPSGYELRQCVNWVNEYRAKLDAEHKLRSENPELKFMWDQYQTYLNMLQESKPPQS
jgi:hypothetical protein